MKFLSASLLLLLALTGCQTGGSDAWSNVWRRSSYYGGPRTSVAVVVLAYRTEARQKLENALAASLSARGVKARVTYPVMDTQTIVASKAAAIDRVKALGVDAVLAVRMVDRKTLDVVQLSSTNAGTTLQPWQNWFDYFTVTSAFATSPEMARPGKSIGLQAAFYANPSGDLLWSATLTPTVTSSPDQAVTLANAVVAKLRAAALVP